MTDDLSKTLLISSYAPPSLAGAPQFMYKLVNPLPPESYIILTSFHNIDNISAKIGTWLPGEYAFYDAPRATKNARLEKTNAPLGVPKRDTVAQLKMFLKRNKLIRGLLGGPLTIGQIPLIVHEGCRIVRSKNIKLLMGFSDYGPAMVSTYWIHLLTKTPFDLYLFDLYKGNFYPFPGNLLANWLEPKLVKSANKVIVTNEGTKEFYRARYGNTVAEKIIVIYNATDPTPYLALRNPFNPQPPYKIVYAGSIYWPQIQSIKNLIKALDQLPNLDIKLQIYTLQTKEFLQSIGIDSPKLEISVAPNKDMPTIQSQADILFLPLSWHTKSPEIINTATPGKLTEYLITGRPILIHAPAESYLVQYAKANDFALVVDGDNVDKLAAAVRRLLTDTTYTQQLADNAKVTFMRNHTIADNAAKFRELLIKKPSN